MFCIFDHNCSIYSVDNTIVRQELTTAAQIGNITYVFQCGAPVNAYDTNGTTLLYKAVQHGLMNVI